MGKLASFQADFRRAIHAGNMPKNLQEKIVEDALSAEARMHVYQNNYHMTLVSLLQGIFPLTSAFVGEEFLKGAAKLFLSDNPPHDPRLERFGEQFPGFLNEYPHASDVIYVADIAKLEWAVHELQHVRALEEGNEAVATHIEGVTLNPNVRLIQSDYPLIQLWMVGMGQLVPEAVHIDAGGQTVAVTLDGFEVKLHVLTDEELET
ncbi:MAG: putative DNA-binding domain-containing protein, partial [Kordiimonas sp.]